MCSPQIGPNGNVKTYTEYTALAMLMMIMLGRLYEETSRVRRALRSIGRLLSAKATVAAVPAIRGMSTHRSYG